MWNTCIMNFVYLVTEKLCDSYINIMITKLLVASLTISSISYIQLKISRSFNFISILRELLPIILNTRNTSNYIKISLAIHNERKREGRRKDSMIFFFFSARIRVTYLSYEFLTKAENILTHVAQSEHQWWKLYECIFRMWYRVYIKHKGEEIDYSDLRIS